VIFIAFLVFLKELELIVMTNLLKVEKICFAIDQSDQSFIFKENPQEFYLAVLEKKLIHQLKVTNQQ